MCQTSQSDFVVQGGRSRYAHGIYLAQQLAVVRVGCDVVLYCDFLCTLNVRVGYAYKVAAWHGSPDAGMMLAHMADTDHSYSNQSVHIYPLFYKQR